jgi:sigma-E factor negative regulatory protein RseC
MQNREGHVVSVRSDDSGTRAVVEVDSLVVCERCESGRGCGAGLLGREPGDKRVEALVAQDLDVQSGDIVSIVLAPRNILRAAVIVYGYPLFGAVSAAIMSYAIGLGDAYGAITALTGLVSGVLLAKFRLRSTRCLREFTPTIVDRTIVDRSSPVPD